MKLALDTNRYRDLCDGDRSIAQALEQADAVFLPFVAFAELRAGFAVGNRGRENERILQRFLAKPGVRVLYATEATTRAYADLYLQLRRQGTPIPINDLWIAALVVENNLLLASRDSHFQYLPQIPVI
ncbi:MAG: type II toxin-antitoxin system VapC family toxin [Thermoanaerobaculia bacterium]|nr:type II toxin-antitoxin system VapC family toxin [Thermoanaerobaculia bacterium]